MEIALGIVNAVSWPVCILWLAYLFRPEIRAVFTRVSSLKFKEFEASFSEELSKTEETLAKLEDSIGPTLPKAPSTPPELSNWSESLKSHPEPPSLKLGD